MVNPCLLQAGSQPQEQPAAPAAAAGAGPKNRKVHPAILLFSHLSAAFAFAHNLFKPEINVEALGKLLVAPCFIAGFSPGRTWEKFSAAISSAIRLWILQEDI